MNVSHGHRILGSITYNTGPLVDSITTPELEEEARQALLGLFQDLEILFLVPFYMNNEKTTDIFAEVKDTIRRIEKESGFTDFMLMHLDNYAKKNGP